jgi:hypothetical protein
VSEPASFSAWYGLEPALVDEHAPDGPAAVQLRRAEGLVTYPEGKSAMVFYFYADGSARAALHKLFSDELAEPGARGHGPLWFRFLEGPLARRNLELLFDEFEDRFGALPVLHG